MRLFVSRLRCPRCRTRVAILRDFTVPTYVAALFGGYFGIAMASLIAFMWGSLWLALPIIIIGITLLKIYEV
jgi:hypothetical protein